MKAFSFSLERVLTWRRTQLTLEESRSEQLRSTLAALEQAKLDVVQRRGDYHSAVLGAAVVSGSELGSLEAVTRWSVAETRRLMKSAAEAEKAIEAQGRVLIEARRRVRLLERLKDRRRVTWKAEFDRELEELGSESAIAQWRRTS